METAILKRELFQLGNLVDKLVILSYLKWFNKQQDK